MTIRERLSIWLQYIYFLRFSILAWLFLPALVFLDRGGYTTSITRAFMAPNSSWQAVHIAFFTFSFQIIVLVTARNICMNGGERFETPPPSTLTWLFCNPGNLPVCLSLTLAQVPAIITMCYIAHIVRIESEANFLFGVAHSSGLIWADFALGILAALFFWYSVSLFYYWTYTEPAGKTGSAPAKPLIFPKAFFGDLDLAPRPIIASILELPLRWLLKLTHHGFAPGPDGPLWELHFLSFVSLIGFFLLYLFLYPLTAPVPRSDDLRIGSIVAYSISGLFILGIVFTRGSEKSKWAAPVKYFFVLLAVGLASIFYYSAQQFQKPGDAERDLPVLATILVICSFTLWAFGGMGFLLDRYRVPVVTTLLLILFVPKLIHWTYGEHYFLAVDHKSNAPLPPSPLQALNLRLNHSSEPLIIITATGGGIHAAAWTTEILGRLEKSFDEDQDLKRSSPIAAAYKFHDHVLLASGVSGGSVGLMSYLLEYTATPAFDSEHLPIDRMTNAAACSSIEDVAWGLEYYDLIRFVTNVWFSRAGTVPPDRNWALSKAFSRNLNDSLCHTSAKDLPGLHPLKKDSGESFTLGTGVEMLRKGQLPAFSLNTTAVETGGRFLLANYQISKNFDAWSNLLPAESFLHAYGEPCDGLPHKNFADLPIATAARLSATFPYVSSASRVPEKYAKFGYHFVDGGYYDNDGTASVIEFLNAALATPNHNLPKDPCAEDKPASRSQTATSQFSNTRTRDAQTDSAPLAILLVEIRNGDDLDPLSNVDDFNFQENPKDKHHWTAVSQLTAPVGALWQAGHESVTRRNRLGLCLLETTYTSSLIIHHVIFNFDPAPPNPGEQSDTDAIQPLNWHLTTAERAQIHAMAYDDPNTDQAINDAKEWVRGMLKRDSVKEKRDLGTQDDEACHVAWVRARPASK